ncbi:hypothetical protein [Aquisphaera insulae]|uniref:hypothetical protein n=1 Tax=Aquisphaera insulae TaxID=2712864 RepID=UPI0013EC403C|nr:hypothetical protein [Aquisphaera insulae]
MVRLRDAVLAVAMAVGGTGCVMFCDECDDFPSPGPPGGPTMLLPGSYTGPPLQVAPDAGPGQESSPAPLPPANPAPPESTPNPADADQPTTPPVPVPPPAADRGRGPGVESAPAVVAEVTSESRVAATATPEPSANTPVQPTGEEGTGPAIPAEVPTPPAAGEGSLPPLPVDPATPTANP